jgi:hypothetical protein
MEQKRETKQKEHNRDGKNRHKFANWDQFICALTTHRGKSYHPILVTPVKIITITLKFIKKTVTVHKPRESLYWKCRTTMTEFRKHHLAGTTVQLLTGASCTRHLKPDSMSTRKMSKRKIKLKWTYN